MTQIPNITLNNGVDIPQVGFGVFLVPDAETQEAVENALDVGYRHIDTARAYDNEGSVGKAIAASGIAREELFITTKCWNDDHGYDKALGAFDASLQRLGLDYVDMYLIHWPLPAKDEFVDTWRAFERLYADGRVRAIGVCNFHPPHLKRLLEAAEVTPAVNQIELHPWLQQSELREVNREHGIVTEAWSPIARARHLDDPTIARIAQKHDTTPAQAMLRWHLELGHVIIPKSVHRERMIANADLFGFELDADDHAAIATLDAGQRVGPDPDTFNG